MAKETTLSGRSALPRRAPGDLDPGLLATPHGRATNWLVITGAPSCGKTTLVDLLAAEGFHTLDECARDFIEKELAGGRTIDEIHEHGAELQRRILAVKLEVENAMSAADVVFLDDAIPGSISWFRLFGLDPNEALRHCFHHRYASVFVLDPLPLALDGVRFDDDFTSLLDEWIEDDYTALGYTVIRVPVMRPRDRLGFVLDRLPGTPARSGGLRLEGTSQTDDPRFARPRSGRRGTPVVAGRACIRPR